MTYREEEINRLIDKVVNAESLDDVVIMSRNREFSDAKLSGREQPDFLSELIAKGVKDEIILFLINTGMQTYYNANILAGDYHHVYSDSLDTALEYKRNDLAEQIADIQISTYFNKYEEYSPYEARHDRLYGAYRSHYEWAYSRAYLNCSEKMGIKILSNATKFSELRQMRKRFGEAINEVFPVNEDYLSKFDDDVMRMVKEGKDSSIFDSVIGDNYDIISLKAIDKIVEYGLSSSFPHDEYYEICLEEMLKKAAYTQLRRASTTEKASEYLNEFKRNYKNLCSPEVVIENYTKKEVVKGMFLNHNPEIVMQGYKIWSTELPDEKIPCLSLEGAKALYDKGFISKEKLGETYIESKKIEEFTKLLKKGLDTSKITTDVPKELYQTFVEHGMNAITKRNMWHHDSERMFTLLKEKNPQQCLKDVIEFVKDTESKSTFLQKLIEQKQVKLNAEDVYKLAKEDSSRINDFLSNYDDAEAYKQARERIAKEKEEARIAEVVQDVPFMSKEKQEETLKKEGNNKEVVKALFASGMDIPADKLKAMFTAEELADVRMSEKNKADATKNEEISAKLAEIRSHLDQREGQLDQREAAVISERATSVNAEESLKSDAERKENFAAKKKLMEKHPIMLEPCLNSMCVSYVTTKDEAIKKEMLSDLYEIRKGGKTNADKREIAKTFKRVLDKNPELKKDENLVALSKVDTVVSQPTKTVKKQIES